MTGSIHFHNELHAKALLCVREYQMKETELLSLLEEIDLKKTFSVLGFESMWRYAVDGLRLTESQASAFLSVMRKSVEVPALKTAIHTGRLSVSQAKRITSVITKTTQDAWIEKAVTLNQRSLEMEVAKENPKTLTREVLRPVSPTRVLVQLGLSVEYEAKLKRYLELQSQKQQKHVTIENVLEAFLDTELPKLEPMLEATHSLRNVKHKSVTPNMKAQVLKRDNTQCTYFFNGRRCTATRWLQLHHKRPKAMGGDNSVSNLTTLCFHHHEMQHGSFSVMLKRKSLLTGTSERSLTS